MQKRNRYSNNLSLTGNRGIFLEKQITFDPVYLALKIIGIFYIAQVLLKEDM